MRRFTTILACLLTAGGIVCSVASYRAAEEPNAAMAARLLNLPVDLTQCRSYSTSFEQIYGRSHFQNLSLIVEPLSQDANAEEWLQGLKARLRIVREGGSVDVDEEITPQFVSVRDSGSYSLGRFSPMPKGMCKFHLDVNSPAAGPAPARQTLVLTYGLCGLEFASAAIAGLVASVLFVIAGIIWLVKLIRYLAGRRRRAAPAEGADGEEINHV